MRGSSLNSEDKDNCEPILYNRDLEITDISVTGKPLDPEEIAHPCGIAAKLYFNDTFTLSNKDKFNTVPLKSKGIAWETDIDH